MNCLQTVCWICRVFLVWHFFLFLNVALHYGEEPVRRTLRNVSRLQYTRAACAFVYYHLSHSLRCRCNKWHLQTTFTDSSESDRRVSAFVGLVLFVVWLFCCCCFLVWQFTDRFTTRCIQKWYWILFDVNFPVAVSLPYVYVGVGDYYAVLHTLFCKLLAQCRSCRWCSVTWDHRTALDHRKVSRS